MVLRKNISAIFPRRLWNIRNAIKKIKTEENKYVKNVIMKITFNRNSVSKYSDDY